MPIKIIQFGEGNFLRAFIDWIIDIMNVEHDYNHGVAIVQPIENGKVDFLESQDNLYHHISRGLKNGEIFTETRLIKCIQKSINPYENIEEYKALALFDTLEIVISNTTEAGIVFSDSQKEISELSETFPSKLTKLLWDRFNHFDGDKNKGLKFIPVELIEHNGDQLINAILKYAELWKLSNEFIYWVNHYNYFANTLVDRIVTGYPVNEIAEIHKNIAYKDELVVASELFHLFVIEGPENIRKSFPADKLWFNVKFVNDITPYKTQKVRILNGAHTCMVPIGLNNGIKTVSETINNKQISKYIFQIVYKEIIPTIDLPEAELRSFADSVIERFRNPFIQHRLNDISLNSISKYKVRVLPTILDYYNKFNVLPHGLILALTNLIHLYLGGFHKIRDDEKVISFFMKTSKMDDKKVIRHVLSNIDFWEQDLNEISGFYDLVLKQYNELMKKEYEKID